MWFKVHHSEISEHIIVVAAESCMKTYKINHLTNSLADELNKMNKLIIFDFENVESLSRGEMVKLIHLQKRFNKRGNSIAIARANDDVTQLLTMSKLSSSIFNLYETTSDAIQSYKSGDFKFDRNHTGRGASPKIFPEPQQ